MSTVNKSIVLCAAFVTWIFFSKVDTSRNRYYYMQKDPASLLPFVPKRMTTTIWSNVSDAVNCARRSYSTFPVSEGFLFNPTSGQCSPLLWLEGPSSPGAQQVQPEEGILYLSRNVCGDDFQIFELANTAGELICLKYFDTTVKIEEAISRCTALGAYLPSVKTVAKLNILRGLATSDMWVGLEFDDVQGNHIWSRDQEVITSQQIKEVFYPGEPNYPDGGENCGNFRIDYQALNDQWCGAEYHYICEKDLPALHI